MTPEKLQRICDKTGMTELDVIDQLEDSVRAERARYKALKGAMERLHSQIGRTLALADDKPTAGGER